MKFFGKRASRKQEPDEIQSPRGRGSSWTTGRSFLAKGMTVGIVALLIAGGASFVLHFLDRPSAIPVASVSGSTADHHVEGAFALEVTAAWMNATRKDPGELVGYVDVDDALLTEEPWAYRDMSVASIAESTPPFVSVTIAANVRETVFDSDGNASEIWPRRYFRIAVSNVDGALAAASLPAPVAAPEHSEPYPLAYGESLTSSDDAGKTVTDFLRAYVTGAGDLTRFISPDSSLVPIVPAPFVQIEPIEISADQVPGEKPLDGEELQVLATMRTIATEERQLAATWALTLIARAGRWEVSDIALAPTPRVSATATTSPVPVPSAPTPAPSSSPAP